MRLSRDIVGKFIDASVSDHIKAGRLLHQHPDLREATWLGDEHLLNFLVIENLLSGLRFCLENGFDANQSDGEFGDSPLHYACMLDYIEVTVVLLQFGADPNSRSEINDTPVHCAIKNGNAEIVDLLLTNGADSNYQTELGDSVFDEWPDDPLKQAQLAKVLQKHHITRQAK